MIAIPELAALNITLTVRAEAGTDTREKAARLLAEQGCPLRHIYPAHPQEDEGRSSALCPV